MKRLSLLILVIIFTIANVNAQKKRIETMQKTPKEIASVDDGDMQTYIMIFLKAGPTKNLSKEKIAELIASHVDFLNSMTEEAMLLKRGTFEENSDVKEVLILNIIELEEAKVRMENDPALKAGLFKIEYHLWKTKSGVVTFP